MWSHSFPPGGVRCCTVNIQTHRVDWCVSSLSSSGCGSTSNPNKKLHFTDGLCLCFHVQDNGMRRWEDASKLHSKVVSPATQMNWKCNWAAGDDVFMRNCPPLVTCLLLFSRLSLWTQTSWMYRYLSFFFFHFYNENICGPPMFRRCEWITFIKMISDILYMCVLQEKETFQQSKHLLKNFMAGNWKRSNGSSSLHNFMVYVFL